MPSKDKKVISTKMGDREYEMLETYANTHNISISAIISLCVRGIIDGDIEIDRGELRIGVDPIGYGISDRLECQFNKLRERGYPDEFIEGIKDQVINGLEMLPKKFDKRKMWNDEGC